LTFWKCKRIFLHVIFIAATYNNLHCKVILHNKSFFLFLINLLEILQRRKKL